MTVSATSSATTATTTTSSSSSSTSSSSTLTSSDFLSLLVSELQNQDPLNATSTTDFINQLTSYANFSQQQSINTNLSSLASSFSSLVTLNSVNYIGHTVEAKTDTATLSNGSATFGYSLSSPRPMSRSPSRIPRATRSTPAPAQAIPGPTPSPGTARIPAAPSSPTAASTPSR